MEKSKRIFLKNGVLSGLGLTIFPNIVFSHLTSAKHLTSNQTVNLNELLQSASLLRKQGNLTAAVSTYNHIILNFPQDIRGYDGKRLCLAKQKYQELNIFNMYSNAMQQYPNNPVFKARWATCCMDIALGNSKFANIISSKATLLQQARQTFNQLRQAYPNNLQYDELFKKARRKQNQNAVTIDARSNQDIKDYKKTKRKQFKNRFNNLPIATLQNKLNLLLAKPIAKQDKKRIKELYLILIRRIRKQNNNQIFGILQNFYLWDKSDTNTLHVIRKICNKRKNFIFLESIERQNHQLKNSLWSALALSEVIVKRFRRNQSGNLNEALSIISNPNLKVVDPIQIVEVNFLKVKIYILQANLQNAKTFLIQLGSNLQSIDNAELFTKYTIFAARWYKKNSNIDLANTALSIALKTTENTKNEDLLNRVLDISKNQNLTQHHVDSISKFRDKLQSNME